jgi:hypothetical protein
MDFIERWFHVSPDNGSGSTEVMYFVAIALVVVAIICRRRFAVLLGVVQIAFGTRINPVIALQSHERTSERAQ